VTDESVLLRLRAEIMRSNLEKIKRFLKEWPRQRHRIEKLETQLREIGLAVNSAAQSINNLDLQLSNLLFQSSFQRLTPMVDEVRKHTAELQTKIAKDLPTRILDAMSNVVEIGTMSFELEAPIEEDISKGFGERIRSPLQKLRNLEKDLASPAAETWSEFQEHVVAPSKAIFNEYIDLVGGIALRDASFDAGICQVADELISTYTKGHSG
jgi:DNA repair exonuclease SbcCD ATPase subunit